MPETQDGNQIEQDQIAQFERAYELRGGLCRLRTHNLEKGDKNKTTANQPGDD
jgi:hypothetical protein